MSEPIRPEPAPGLTPLVSMFPLHINEPEPARPARDHAAGPARIPTESPAVPQPARQPGRQAAG